MSLPVDEDDIRMLSSNYPPSVNDWMKAIRRPTQYRVGNARVQLKPRVVFYAVTLSVAVLILLIMVIPRPSRQSCLKREVAYDSTYPLTQPFSTRSGKVFKIALVTDLDTHSKGEKPNTWYSYYRLGNLTLSNDQSSVRVFLNTPIVLESSLAQGGRGMELSELIVFNGKTYTVDDRTGVVYEIVNNRLVIPWVMLPDGNGKFNKGFKCEWATVKDKHLYVGGLGKEWTTTKGEVVNLNPQWVKAISPTGEVEHIDWHNNYNALRRTIGMELPGYIIHEAGVWSDVHRKWFFLPRRASKEKYDEAADERRGTNLMFIVDEEFQDISVKTVGTVNPTHGFSSFKFVPGTRDTVMVALKSEEIDGKIASFILAFNIHGSLLMPEQKIGDVKYEGIEFV